MKQNADKHILKILIVICFFFVFIGHGVFALEIDLGAKKSYDAAFELLKQDKHDDAVKEFKSLLAGYPNSPFSEDAHYWIGKSYWMKKDYDSALRGIYNNNLKIP